MQILSSEQVRLWDEFTVHHEPISSLGLMERAATSCLAWLEDHDYLGKTFHIFCGKGNNGGDGLALARMLFAKKSLVIVHILEFGHKGTADFQANLAKLHETKVEIRFIQSIEHFHNFSPGEIILDALYGSGLNRPLDGISAKLIEHLNASGNIILAIDLPSGLYADKSSKGNPVIHASCTLSFQCYKLALLFAENHSFIGEVFVLDIGLMQEFLAQIETEFFFTGPDTARVLLKPRSRFANKGNFGHALLVVGGYGKMGAAVLACKSCLRTGAGLVTVHVPASGYDIMQTSVPEAMVLTDENQNVNTRVEGDLSKFACVGLGPGLGTSEPIYLMLRNILQQTKRPLVIDADALNIMSTHQELFAQLPPYSILTPHPKEFERLFGASINEFERLMLAIEKSKKYNCVIVLKGHYTAIVLPEGKVHFNSTGNSGMAKGGSGDVLTGMITSLCAQNYAAKDAAILGVFIHGLAGDFAARHFSEYSMTATDIVDKIAEAFKSIEQ